MIDSDADLLARFHEGLLAGEELATFHTRMVADPAFARAVVRSAADAAIIRAWAAAPRPEVRRRPWGRRAFFAALTGLAAAIVAWLGGWLAPAVVVAKVDRDSGCEWAIGPAAGRIHPGRDLKLTAGVAEVVTERGVRVVFEGPAAFRFDSATAVNLTEGQAHFQVPPSGAGFAVSTPDGRIAVQGTQFGVSVTPVDGTEVHVFEGRVTVQVDESSAQLEVAAGKAGRLRRSAAAIPTIPVSEKFVTGCVVVEPFDYGRGTLAGRGGWREPAGVKGEPAGVSAITFAYPGMPAPRGGVLELNSPHRLNQGTRPVVRRWPGGYTSAILRLDDDFVKVMAAHGVKSAGLFQLGSADGAGVWVVARPGRSGPLADPGKVEFGVRLGGREEWASAAVGADPAHLLVVKVRGETVRLWVDPVVGAEPPPVLVQQASPVTGPRVIQLGDVATPSYCWWFLKELRCGPTWSDAVPPPGAN